MVKPDLQWSVYTIRQYDLLFQFVRVRLKSEQYSSRIQFYSQALTFLIADARTIYCSQNNRSYGRNRIDALLEVNL